jgi:DNA-binding LytR/AlgR family response regulator
MSSIVVIVLAAPILFVAVRRMRRASGGLLRLALAAAAIIAFSTLHIAGVISLRKMVTYLVGVPYDFRFSAAALMYEFRKDLITCLMIGGSLWLVDSRRETQQSRLVAAAAPPDPPSGASHPIWLRDGSTRIRIEPSDILWVGSAGNYVEYSLVDGRSHLVRGTLAGEERRLARLNIARVHRTRLVNLARVNGFRPGPNGDFELTLDTGQVVPGSRRYRDAVASIEALAAKCPIRNGW